MGTHDNLMTTDDLVRYHRTSKYGDRISNGVRAWKSTPETIALQLRTAAHYMHVELVAHEVEELIARLTGELAKGLRTPVSRDPTPEAMRWLEQRIADSVDGYDRDDSIVQTLRRYGHTGPITREDYISFNWAGCSIRPWSAEYEAELPLLLQDWERFERNARRRQKTAERAFEKLYGESRERNGQ